MFKITGRPFAVPAGTDSCKLLSFRAGMRTVREKLIQKVWDWLGDAVQRHCESGA